jgi:NADH-quinone oxidoreductase subunit M
MLTAILIALPFLTGLLVITTGGEQSKRIALGAALAELVVAAIMLAQFQINAESQFVCNIPWIPSLGINFHVAVDGISMLMILLTTVLTPLIIYSSFGHHYSKPQNFYGLILLMQMALIGVFTAMDGFLFYIFWELALIPIYFICLLWGGENRAKITFKFFLYTMVGSLFMLVALIYLFQQTPGTHSFDINALYAAGQALDIDAQRAIFWGLFLAFAIKMPIFPLHTWQPDTYVVAPTQGTMLLSGIMLKMGIYGAIRWLLPMVPDGVAAYADFAMVLAIIGIIYASLIAWVQTDMKRLIAYSSIAHVGLIAAGVFSLNEQGISGAVFQMLSHGINVFALFFIVDMIEQRTKTRLMGNLGGVRTIAPKFATFFMVIMMGSVALPLTNGFPGEFLLLNGVYQASGMYAFFAGITIILGAVYMLNAYQKTMLGEVSAATENFEEPKAHETHILWICAILVIVMGVYPKPLFSIAEPAIQQLLTMVK